MLFTSQQIARPTYNCWVWHNTFGYPGPGKSCSFILQDATSFTIKEKEKIHRLKSRKQKMRCMRHMRGKSFCLFFVVQWSSRIPLTFFTQQSTTTYSSSKSYVCCLQQTDLQQLLLSLTWHFWLSRGVILQLHLTRCNQPHSERKRKNQ